MSDKKNPLIEFSFPCVWGGTLWVTLTRKWPKSSYYVYILTNKNGNVMYVGMTNVLARRLYEHKTSLVEGFTKKYRVHKLVYLEVTENVHSAIEREKEIKKWRREKKNQLVDIANPKWEDLSMKWRGRRFLAIARNDS